VTVIDLKAKPIAASATLEAGLGATGVSINPSQTLALVCNRNEGTVSIFKISGKTLTPAGKIQLGGEKSGPSHAAFTPDGKMALVSRDGDHKVSVLKIDGDTVTDTKHAMTGGFRPYSLEISSKGDVAVFGNQGGGQGDEDVINVVDMKSSPPHVVDTISVGQTPEGVGMSPSGSYVAVTVMNGSNKAKSFPFYHDNGLLRVYSINGTKLTHVADANVGHWCQGAVWSKDEKTVAVQCMIEKEVQFYDFDGKSLKRNGEIKLKAGGAGLRAAQ
jgi:DNA-binding beta-propeller fold protein YncE